MEFIIYTNTVWDSPPRSRHQLAYALSKRYKVTFVGSNKLGKPGIKAFKINDSMDVIIPRFPVSRRIRYRTPVINEIYQKWLFPILRNHFVSKKDVIVICADFGGYMIKNYFDKLIYFASDDFINNVKVPFFIKAYTSYTQKKLIIASDIALATAKKLVHDFKVYNELSFELPLGAPDFKINHDSEAVLRKRDGKIKVVLLGYIDKVKTPVRLLLKILSIENTELYLIGPIKDNILEELYPTHKVHALGPQTGEMLSKTLTEMDVAIAPYYMEDSNTGRTPNKMWQYLAAGKPAVITNLPNVRHWNFPEGTVYKANTDNEFVEMVQIAYQEDSTALIKKRIELAKENSWDKRAEFLIELINQNIIKS